VDRVVFASGSAGTHAGILVGVKALGLDVRVEGIAVETGTDLYDQIVTLAPDTAAHLGLEIDLAGSDVILHDAYGMPGYGMITDVERQAIRLLARTEGVVVDPVYTGRALAGLIDRIRQGTYGSNETVLFWHTGGVAGLFARAEELILDP